MFWKTVVVAGLKHAATESGRKALKKIADTVVRRAVALANSRGLTDREVTYAQAMEQLKMLRARGLSKEDFEQVKVLLKQRFSEQFARKK